MTYPYRFLLLLFILAVCVATGFAQESEADLWQTVPENNAGITLQYPATWEFSSSENAFQLVFDEYALQISSTPPTGTPAGIPESLAIRVGAYRLGATALVLDGQVNGIFYDVLQTPDEQFFIQLTQTATNPISIPQVIIQTAHLIVSTIQIEDVTFDSVVGLPYFAQNSIEIDTWETYLHSTEPFGFRYPPEWTMIEGDQQITFTYQDAQLIIAYDATQNVPSGELDVHADLPSGERRERATVSAFHTELYSNAIYLQNELQPHAVTYSQARTADHVFAAWLVSEMPLTSETIVTADQILASFKTNLPATASNG